MMPLGVEVRWIRAKPRACYQTGSDWSTRTRFMWPVCVRYTVASRALQRSSGIV